MASLSIDTPEGIRIQTEIAGVGSRTAAAFLDILLLVGGYLVFLLSLLTLQIVLKSSGTELLAGVPDFVFGILEGGFALLLPLYFIAFHLLWNGQTPGKRSLGIRVVAIHGAPVNTTQCILRGLLWPLDAFLIVPVPLGMLLMVVTPHSRRLGDLAAGTLVLREARAARYEEPWPKESWATRENKALELSPGMRAKLDAEDVRLLRDAICRKDLPPQSRDSIYRSIVQHYATQLGFVPAESTRTSLKELYLFARESRGA